MDLLLEENPVRRRRRRAWNPMELDYNPRRRRMPRRRNVLDNPVSTRALKQWTQGIGGEEVIGAIGGLLLAGMLPPMLVKTIDTTSNKLLRVAVGFGSAVLAGMAGKAISPKAGQAAVLGGLAGATMQAITSFTPVKLASSQLSLPAGGMGETRVVSFPTSRQEETVSMIQP